MPSPRTRSGEGKRDGVAPAEGELENSSVAFRKSGEKTMVYGTRPGKLTKNYGKSPCLMILMGKSTISMAIFNSFLYVYQRVDITN